MRHDTSDCAIVGELLLAVVIIVTLLGFVSLKHVCPNNVHPISDIVSEGRPIATFTFCSAPTPKFALNECPEY
jgi:hypothetical protein